MPAPLGNLALDQRAADEDLATQRGIDIAVADAAPRIEHDAVQRGALPGTHRSLTLLPVRLEDMSLDEVRPTSSSHSGSMRAMQRPNRREVSTSSAQTIHLPAFLASVEPGCGQNLMPRAPGRRRPAARRHPRPCSRHDPAGRSTAPCGSPRSSPAAGSPSSHVRRKANEAGYGHPATRAAAATT